MAVPGLAAGEPSIPQPKLSVSSDGSPAASVAIGETLDVTASGPVEASGAQDQRISTTWDPDDAALKAGSIVRPAGWDLKYTTNGDTWSSSPPAQPSDLAGVRAEGDITSGGLTDNQVASTTNTGEVQTSEHSFTSNVGGNAPWNVFTDETRVFGVIGSGTDSYNLDCHVRSTNASCGPVYSIDGYLTGPMTTGNLHDVEVISFVVEVSSGDLGTLCTNVSTTPFTNCGFTPLAALGITDRAEVGSMMLQGDRTWAATSAGGGTLVCYDRSEGGLCSGHAPISLPGFDSTLSGDQVHVTSFLNIYVMANKVWCFDDYLFAPCAGSWPVGSFSGDVHPPVPMRDHWGNALGLCVLEPLTCFQWYDATPVTPPPALADMLAEFPVTGPTNSAIGTSFGAGYNRQFWPTGPWSGDNPLACFDWETNAPCANFDGERATGAERTTISTDPSNYNCLWTTGADGTVSAFDPDTGESGCAASRPVVVVPAAKLVPRMSCAASGRVREYDNLTLEVSSYVSLTSSEVTVRDSDGNAVPGFTNLNPDNDGHIDLSGLAVADTGSQPSIAVELWYTRTKYALAAEMRLSYESAPPQLCLKLTPRKDCPQLAEGIATSDTLPVADFQVAGNSALSTGGPYTGTTFAAEVSRARMPHCLGTVKGKLQRTDGSGAKPYASRTLQLRNASGTVLATTTSDANGSYSFGDRVIPGSYFVTSEGKKVAVTAEAETASAANLLVRAAAADTAFPKGNAPTADTSEGQAATGGLPKTGGAPVHLLLLALGMTAAGGGLLLSGTRRRAAS